MIFKNQTDLVVIDPRLVFALNLNSRVYGVYSSRSMDLKLDDFSYDLPEDRIAKHPVENRSESKLLAYLKGEISHHQFTSLPDLIPKDSLLLFNDTRVIPARIILHKETGARVEVFLLEPILPSNVHEEVMNAKSTCSWKCLIGNAKRWKEGSSLVLDRPSLKATRTSDDTVTFEWSDNYTFSELLVEIGKIPLPPYLNREVELSDEDRYQTVYAKTEGAVAAPTAGLHFTDEVLEDLKSRGVQIDYLTLHVSAGTFQPIQSDDITEHPMHNEQIWITRENIERLLQNSFIISVGTTVMRTLESLYWFGVKLLSGEKEFLIHKDDPYNLQPVERDEALSAVLQHMESSNLTKIGGQTEIFLYPGYTFRICNGLVTNYHLPGSTLILLVAAFVGEDWRRIYQEALANNYRFLSYGDSSLLIP